jgi:hypothetical protein
MTLRSTLLLGAAALAITCSSCVRDYTCQCTIKYTGQPSLPDSTLREYPIRDKKDAAKTLCEENSVHETDQATGIKTDEDCKLF